eukprot:m.689504 g.689504  ORF g.689504 m.689504 type:complete len:271 (-) comp22847_c0_seq15:1701-2513(-)
MDPPSICRRRRELYDEILLGMITSLEKRPDFGDLRVCEYAPATDTEITSWEMEVGVLLPPCLKALLRTSNGLEMEWSILEANGTSQRLPVPLGHLHLHGLDAMHPLPGNSSPSHSLPLAIAGAKNHELGALPIHSNRVIPLDNCDGDGIVALVYVGNSSPQVWFSTRSGDWYFVAASFSAYTRLMAVHLGIPGWQYAFTPCGVSSSTGQWLERFAPLRRAMDAARESFCLGPAFNGNRTGTIATASFDLGTMSTIARKLCSSCTAAATST